MARKFKSFEAWDETNEYYVPCWYVEHPYEYNNPVHVEGGRIVVSVPNCNETMAAEILSVDGAVTEVFDPE